MKKLWLSCDYARVEMTPRGRGQPLDALMIKVNGEWRFGMIADPDAGAARPSTGPATATSRRC